jgi:hypothetical protein
MSLQEWLARDPERCLHGYHRVAQTCPDCPAVRRGSQEEVRAMRAAGNAAPVLSGDATVLSPSAGKAEGIARADAAADPNARAAIDAAIARLAATGEEWSANELRVHVPGITGAIMGARFSAAAKAGLIRDTGKRVPSTLGSTHAHEVRVWVGVAA